MIPERLLAAVTVVVRNLGAGFDVLLGNEYQVRLVIDLDGLGSEVPLTRVIDEAPQTGRLGRGVHTVL